MVSREMWVEESLRHLPISTLKEMLGPFLPESKTATHAVSMP